MQEKGYLERREKRQKRREAAEEKKRKKREAAASINFFAETSFVRQKVLGKYLDDSHFRGEL